jgi:pyruvate dehydrogenase E2 component (dihydrolipoamide acetyltransferase)
MGPRPVARDGELAVASVTTLGLSVDHRVLDGVRAAQLLGEVRRLLEQPEELMSGGPGLGE